MPRPKPRFLALLAAALLLSACERPPREVVLTGPTMGTTWTVRVVPEGEGRIDAETLRSLVQSSLEEVDAAMSTYRTDSAVSRFNASESLDWVAVPASLARLVELALQIGDATGGALDITVSPVVKLWGFGNAVRREQPPTDREIAAAQADTGQRHLAVQLEPPALRKARPGLTLDLDSIAPGYAADLLAERLEAAGQRRYMIDIGGELRVRGHNAQGEPWRIGIERPEALQRSVERVIRLEDGAVSTSGDYRDFFESAGVRYSHTLDPRSGRPVAHGLASVTVLRPTAAEADGIATALTVLGPIEGYELAERLGWAALFIERTPDGFRHRETGAFKQAAQTRESGP
jgi:thiamine biosynthesis lipoprotein